MTPSARGAAGLDRRPHRSPRRERGGPERVRPRSFGVRAGIRKGRPETVPCPPCATPPRQHDPPTTGDVLLGTTRHSEPPSLAGRRFPVRLTPGGVTPTCGEG